MTVCRYSSRRSQPGHRSWGGGVSGVDVNVGGRLVRLGRARVAPVSAVLDGSGSADVTASDSGLRLRIRMAGSRCLRGICLPPRTQLTFGLQPVVEVRSRFAAARFVQLVRAPRDVISIGGSGDWLRRVGRSSTIGVSVLCHVEFLPGPLLTSWRSSQPGFLRIHAPSSRGEACGDDDVPWIPAFTGGPVR